MGNIDGFKEALEALQNLDEKDRERILFDIAKKDPKIANRLRDNLFSFSDLQFMLATDFKVIWWEVPKTIWYLAFRKAPTGVLKMVQTHLSVRAYDQFIEDINALGPQSFSKVLSAQKELCDSIRNLAVQGKIALPSSKKNDPIV